MADENDIDENDKNVGFLFKAMSKYIWALYDHFT